jgi:hypothetical protein
MSPSHLFKIYFNIILPSRPGSHNWALSLRSAHQNPVGNKSPKGWNSSCISEQPNNSQIPPQSRVMNLSMLQCQHTALCIHLLSTPPHSTCDRHLFLITSPCPPYLCDRHGELQGQQQFKLSQRRQKLNVSEVEDELISMDAMKVYGQWRYGSTQFFR